MPIIEQLLHYYSNCRVPTQQEIMQAELGMDDEEFKYFMQFQLGINDIWLVFT
jgi:hypothetical protein